MPMPTHSEISRALLEALKDGQPHALEDLRAYIIRRFNITEQELAEKNSRGKPMLLERLSMASRPLLAERLSRASRPLLLERLSRAVYLLKDAGLIAKPQYATYAITQKGLDELAKNSSQQSLTEDVNSEDLGSLNSAENLNDLSSENLNAENLNEETEIIQEEPEVSQEPEFSPEEQEQENLENIENSEPEEPEIEPENTEELMPEITPEETEVLFNSNSNPEIEPEIEPEGEQETEEAKEQQDNEGGQEIMPEAIETEEQQEQNEEENKEEESGDGIMIDGTEDEDKEAEAEVEAEVQDGGLEILETGDVEPEVEPVLQIEEDIDENVENVEDVENIEEIKEDEVEEDIAESAESAENVESVKEIAGEPEEAEEVEEPEIEPEEPKAEIQEKLDDDNAISDELSEELVIELNDVFGQFNEMMTFAILDNVYKLSDAAFEQFVIDLFSKMGQRAFQNARYTSMSGESEIHGLIIDEKHPSSPIYYIHATRQNPSQLIDDAEVEKFAATVESKGGRGVFVTTAKFSQNIWNFADKNDMLLIDGYKLARLMMAHNFCVRAKEAFEVKAFDADALKDYED